MKKIFTLMMAALMMTTCLVLTSCGNEADVPNYVGKWTYYSDIDDFTDTFRIDEDGTYAWGCNGTYCDEGVYTVINSNVLKIVSDVDKSVDTLSFDGNTMKSANYPIGTYYKEQ